jgi:hypothetical protein
MLSTALRRLGLRGKPTRSRPVPTRPSFRPTLELLERRDVPSISPISDPSVVAASQHSDPYNGSSIVSYEIGYSSFGNTVTAYITEQFVYGQPQPTDSNIAYTIRNSSGTVTAPVFIDGDRWDSFSRFVSGPHCSDNAQGGLDGVTVAVGANGQFAIAYLIDSWHYPDDTTTTPDSETASLYVRKFAADGTALSGPILVAQVVNNDPQDSPQGEFLEDPRIGVDATGTYTLVWRDITQVQPINGQDAWEVDKLYVARDGYTTQLAAQTYLDAGLGFGAPGSWNGYRITWPDLATNASGQSVVVWARKVTVHNCPASIYMQLDAIMAQHVDATGALQGPPVTVTQNATTFEPNADPLVAMNDSGAFVVSWNYIPPYTIPDSMIPVDRGVYARLFKANGASTNEFLVIKSPDIVPPPPGVPLNPAYYYLAIEGHPVGIDAAGNFVVGWEESTTDQTPFPKERVQVQAYDANGNALGKAVTIAGDGNPFFGSFELVMAPDGTFVAAGHGTPPPGSDDAIVAQLFQLT